ncbi:RNA polymerase sigma factor [Dyadobacter linearis]|nr:RNA polymerase sigma factor [Dyadobacter sp. CECT 9623]
MMNIDLIFLNYKVLLAQIFLQIFFNNPYPTPSFMPLKSTCYCEQDLVVLLKNNNRLAFEYLYDNYASGLYGIICKMVRDDDVASDVLQEAFIKIWKNISYYDHQKGSLFTWMLNITRHTAIDHIRAARKFANNIQWAAVDEKDLSNTAISFPKPVEIGLETLVETLPPERKQLIELVYFQGYTHQEASEHLCLPLGTVKSRIRSALTDLKRIFEFSAPVDKLVFS